MAKQQTLIQRFWHNVLHNPTTTAVVADSKDGKGDLAVPFICNCAAYWASSMSSPYMYAMHIPCECQAPVSWFSWKHVGTRVAEIMSYLTENGFQKGDRAAIISDNRREWVEADYAIQSLGGITVPIFAHTNADQMNDILEDSGANFAFVESKRQLAKVSTQLIGKILFDAPREPMEDTTVASIKAIYERGKSAEMLKQIAADQKSGKGFAAITHDDLARIIYTSGTTKRPKGVMLSHGNIAYALLGISRHGFKLRNDDLYLSALPLAHVYGLTDGQDLATWSSMASAFCRITEVGESSRLLQPSVKLGVPKLWRKIRDAIEVELMRSSGMKARIIKWAFKGNKRGPSRWLADALVFSKIRARLGGRIRVAMSGGAALSGDVQQFFTKIGIRLSQGYGMTETTGAISASLPEQQEIGSSGRILDFVDVAIMPHESVPADLGIETWGPLVDKKLTTCRPQAGEIWLKGPQIFKGYWNNPEATKEVFTEDGWFKTGDAGVIYNRNYLCVTGRIARVIKNENGKWIPVDRIEESVYTADQEDQFSIIQIIVPIAGSEYKFTGGLVFIDPVEAKLLLEHHGITPPIAELEGNACAFYAQHPLIREKVVEAIKKANSQLQIWERIKRIQIVEDEATVDGGHLTPTLKVKAEAIRRMYRSLEKSIYASAKALEATTHPDPIDID